jgi:hypothetical protein
MIGRAGNATYVVAAILLKSCIRARRVAARSDPPMMISGLVPKSQIEDWPFSVHPTNLRRRAETAIEATRVI